MIRDQQMFRVKVTYNYNNPVKEGLVSEPADYKYSSARNYIKGNHAILEINVEYAGIRML